MTCAWLYIIKPGMKLLVITEFCDSKLHSIAGKHYVETTDTSRLGSQEVKDIRGDVQLKPQDST